MPLVRKRPELDPNEKFIVKEAQSKLGVTAKIFTKYRKLGLIEPINPLSTRPKFTGESIMLCYDKAIML